MCSTIVDRSIASSPYARQELPFDPDEKTRKGTYVDQVMSQRGFAAAVERVVQSAGSTKLLVTCSKGLHRSPVVAAGAAELLQEQGPPRAIDRVRCSYVHSAERLVGKHKLVEFTNVDRVVGNVMSFEYTMSIDNHRHGMSFEFTVPLHNVEQFVGGPFGSMTFGHAVLHCRWLRELVAVRKLIARASGLSPIDE
jgi:hypothetical protein